MAVAPVSAATASNGLDFQSLLNIILQQLTYQDPLKPVDNFEFVSQLGQFAQLQQTQTMNDQITSLLDAQSATQATGLLGRTVAATTNAGAAITGQVTAITFSSGAPLVTITNSDGVTPGISIANISEINDPIT
jgi:flagellar basal-body rod modification protein FlgD